MKRIQILLLLAVMVLTAAAKDYTLSSPSGHLTAKISTDGVLKMGISCDGQTITAPSAIAIQTTNGIWGKDVKVTKASTRSVDEFVDAINYKRKGVRDCFNELTLKCSGEFSLVVRAYDDGCAYRLVSNSKKPLRVVNELVEFSFTEDCKAFVPYVNDNRGGERFCYSFESYYDEQKLSEMFADSLAITPLAVTLPGGKRAVVMETSVENYPGLFLRNASKAQHGDRRLADAFGAKDACTLTSEIATLPLETVVGGFDRLNLMPTKRADYIADIKAGQQLPWRMVLVTTSDVQLLATTTPYCLAPACRLKDTSWIKPGKVAWDWWNNWNISGVDFRAGINTRTYKYYIDFAQKNGLEYVIVDEGWSSEEDLLTYSNDSLSIPELVAYGAERGVGIILWTSWRNLIKNMERNMSHYAAQGVKGFKVDFFDRDDQEVISSSYAIAECAAKQHLLVDYHGLKPSGVQRAFPNVLNFEGVKGLENCKWEPRVGNAPLHDMPRYDVTIPYLRMLPGPLDYTPGAMLNATNDHFFGNNNHPMSQGTRVHQMAMYTIFEAPLQMLADSPTHYMQNQECTDFIAQVPTVFDETIPLCGEMGEYVAIARRKGNTWYLAAMNNWTALSLKIDLSQVLYSANGMDRFSMVAFEDGVNADREATDYRRTQRTVGRSDSFTVKLAPGGGWTAIIRPM